MKRSLKKIVSVVLAVIMVMSVIPTLASAKEVEPLGEIDGIEVRERVVLSIGETYDLKKPENASHLLVIERSNNGESVEAIYEEDSDFVVATKILAKSEGVDLVYVVEVYEGYDDEGNETDFGHLEQYWLVVVVKPYGKTENDMGKITDAYMEDVTVDYKDDFNLFPMVETYNDDDAYYCTYFVTNYEAPVYVYDDGSFYASETGSTAVTCYVVDAQGEIFSSDFTFTVKYTPKQWIVKFLLFGWLWEFISNVIFYL